MENFETLQTMIDMENDAQDQGKGGAYQAHETKTRKNVERQAQEEDESLDAIMVVDPTIDNTRKF